MRQGGGQDSDQTANFFWFICLLFGVALAFWWVDSEYIVRPVFFLRCYELDAIRFLAQLWIPVAQAFHLPLPDIHKLDSLQVYMQTAVPQHVSWKNFAAINDAIGQWTRYPVSIFLFCLALFILIRKTGQFQHNYNMKTLRVAGQEVWPQITPIISLDLVKEDIDKGPWAMAKLPLDFCRQHDLLLMKVVSGKRVWTLKQKPAYRLFALQLGPMWKGLDVLPIHVKALAVIFLARASGNRPLAKKFLSQIAASAATGKLDFSGVSDALKQFNNHRIISWLEKRHAYMTTFMATLLEIARSDGVLASAEFLWLKPVDRRLWFVLNSVGRRTSVVEVAGVFAHWKAEQKIGRLLKTPMIKAAVDGLDEALQNVLFVDKGEQWHTTSAD